MSLRIIKPIPKEALELLEMTVSTQNDESANNTNTEVSKPPRTRKVYKIPPALATELLADTQPSKHYFDERQRRIDDLANASTSSGGNKKKDTYTVKELKTIASRNNIKTTKKLNGKTVPLNKKGLVAKLKRNKVI